MFTSDNSPFLAVLRLRPKRISWAHGGGERITIRWVGFHPRMCRSLLVRRLPVLPCQWMPMSLHTKTAVDRSRQKPKECKPHMRILTPLRTKIAVNRSRQKPNMHKLYMRIRCQVRTWKTTRTSWALLWEALAADTLWAMRVALELRPQPTLLAAMGRHRPMCLRMIPARAMLRTMMIKTAFYLGPSPALPRMLGILLQDKGIRKTIEVMGHMLAFLLTSLKR